MILNLALICIAALIMAALFERLRLPGLLGMMAIGICFGPQMLDFIHPKVLEMSAELRSAALLVILIRAGLGIRRSTLNSVGIAALKMSMIPAALEGTLIIFATRILLGLDWAVCGVLAFVLAAVSLAVVVPEMLVLRDQGYGAKKGVPTLLLASSSLDNVFALTVFGVFMIPAQGGNLNYSQLILTVPLGVAAGIAFGVLCGFALLKIFHIFPMRATKKAIVFAVLAIVFNHFGRSENVQSVLPLAVLPGVMAMGFVILECDERIAHEMSQKFNKLWIVAEIALFVLVGAQLNLHAAWTAGAAGIVIIAVGLAGRSIGVYLSLLFSRFNGSERLFCAISYLPKATMQAAIGAVPLAAGIEGGQTILAIAVLSIIVTAPLGTFLIRLSYKKLLGQDYAQS